MQNRHRAAMRWREKLGCSSRAVLELSNPGSARGSAYPATGTRSAWPATRGRGNLPWSVDDASMREMFSRHGEVISARVITDMAVLDVVPGKGLKLVERAPGVSTDEIRAATEAALLVEGDVPEMSL